MLGAATPALAAAVTRAGGIGFLPGSKDATALGEALKEAKSLIGDYGRSAKLPAQQDCIPVGIGFQNWAADINVAIEVVRAHHPAIVWFFAPEHSDHLEEWASRIREAGNGSTHIWVQVGTVQEALDAARLARPEVLILQGTDAGGHGLVKSASIISLVPEAADALAMADCGEIQLLAAGGICDGRGVAAALALGASGVVMGTRFLASQEAGISEGWKDWLLRADDGGSSTTRSTLCDRLKTTVGWPEHYDGRSLIGQGHHDEKAGMPDQDNVTLYKEEVKAGNAAWGEHGRQVAYAGTGVGLLREVLPAAEIIANVQEQASDVLIRMAI